MGRYFFLSGVVSISTYIILLISLSFYFYKNSHKPKVYSLKQETVLEVAIQSVPNRVTKEIKESKTQKNLENLSKESASNIDKRGGSISPKKSSSNFKSLFSSVNVKKPKKVSKTVPFRADHIASRFKSKDVKSIKNPKVNISKLSSTNSIKKSVLSFEKKLTTGEVNEYYAKIYEILAKSWSPNSSDVGYVGIIIVTVTNRGEFDYKIKQLSNNKSFNQKLVQFLDSMKLKKFPPYKDGDKSTIEVYFKTEE